MKKLLVYLTVLFGISSFAQSGAKIEFKEETINYGDVEKGKDENNLVLNNLYPNEPKANNTDKIKVTKNGTLLISI